MRFPGLWLIVDAKQSKNTPLKGIWGKARVSKGQDQAGCW